MQFFLLTIFTVLPSSLVQRLVWSSFSVRMLPLHFFVKFNNEHNTSYLLHVPTPKLSYTSFCLQHIIPLLFLFLLVHYGVVCGQTFNPVDYTFAQDSFRSYSFQYLLSDNLIFLSYTVFCNTTFLRIQAIFLPPKTFY